MGTEARSSRTAAEPLSVAVVSDTHGLLRPEVLPLLHGAAHILHAGDVGDPEILNALATIAPVSAVRGNIDVSGVLASLAATEAIEVGGHLIYMLHRLQDLDLNPAVAGISVVISGHTHKAAIRRDNNVLYLNPGSIGPRRFRLPITLARLTLYADRVEAEIIPVPSA